MSFYRCGNKPSQSRGLGRGDPGGPQHSDSGLLQPPRLISWAGSQEIAVALGCFLWASCGVLSWSLGVCRDWKCLWQENRVLPLLG